jgi:hypothetical protein
LVLDRGSRVPAADPIGRHGSVVMAEPEVFRVDESAEIAFKSVVWFQVADELEKSIAFADRDSDATFEGRYFRYYSKSGLLNELRTVHIGAAADRLKHYQLVTDDTLVDIVSTEAPDVALRGRHQA